MTKNPFERQSRWITDEEQVLIDDVQTEVSELWEVLSKLERFADIRSLSLAYTKLEECWQWAVRACDVSDR